LIKARGKEASNCVAPPALSADNLVEVPVSVLPRSKAAVSATWVAVFFVEGCFVSGELVLHCMFNLTMGAAGLEYFVRCTMGAAGLEYFVRCPVGKNIVVPVFFCISRNRANTRYVTGHHAGQQPTTD